MDSIGDRMKRYEKVSTCVLTPRMPVIIRCDGRAFHTFARKYIKPFDKGLIATMVSAAKETAKDMQGFKVAYVQSDEVSFLLTDFDSIDTQGWFNYEVNKMVSTSAALMSVFFNKFWGDQDVSPTFDSRVFNVPREDIANYFLWRAKDWSRNSIQMYARSFFSQKQLHGKKRDDLHEMLHSVGKNWATDLCDQVKNGTWILNKINLEERHDILPNFQSINEAIGIFEMF